MMRRLKELMMTRMILLLNQTFNIMLKSVEDLIEITLRCSLQLINRQQIKEIDN